MVLFLTWLPGYLATEMNMSILKSGWYSAIPLIVGTITEIVIGAGLLIVLLTKGITGRVSANFSSNRYGIWFVNYWGSVYSQCERSCILDFNSTWRSCCHICCCLQHSYIYCTKRNGRNINGLLTFGNNSMAIVAPITTGFIVQATGSFMYAFLLAAAF